MVLVTILIAIVLLSFLWAALRGHYIFAIALVLIAGYEVSGPALFLLGEDRIATNALLLFADYASEQSIMTLVAGLLGFFALFIATYVAAGPLFQRRKVVAASQGDPSEALLIVPVVLLVFGLISMATGAGQTRLEDYGWTGVQTTEYSRFFSYGGVLLVIAAYLTVQHAVAKQVWIVMGVILCAAPLLVELFIGGRRQWFAPSFFLVLLFLFYGNAKYKFLLSLALALALSIVFAFQYGLRELAWLQAETTIATEPWLYGILAPQAVEFVAIGATSFYAWHFFAYGAEQPTGGFQWIFQILNSVPFLKLGDMLYPSFNDRLQEIYGFLTPWGGLSAIADGVLAFGVWGLPLAALLLALFCRFAHESVSSAFRDGIPTNLQSVYTVSLIATLLTKYRSGFGDAIQAAIAFSILYWAIVLFGRAVFDVLFRPAARRDGHEKVQSIT
jgi:hypothetical protein